MSDTRCKECGKSWPTFGTPACICPIPDDPMPGTDALAEEDVRGLIDALAEEIEGAGRLEEARHMQEGAERELGEDLAGKIDRVAEGGEFVGYEELQNRFTYHAPSPRGVDTHGSLSTEFLRLALLVDVLCPPGREKSLALTKLEEAKFWASAAVARNPGTR